MREGPLQIGDVVPYVPYQERRLLRSDVFPRAWFVVQSVSHGEDKVREALAEAGYATFFPMVKKEIRQRRVKKWIVREFPLFNRMIFAELPVDVRYWGRLFRHEAVAGVLGSNGVPRALGQTDVERLIAKERAGDFDETPAGKLRRRKARQTARQKMAERFPIGSRVRAKLGGPFGGFSGHVTSVSGRDGVTAMIEIFGRMTPVEFDVEMIEAESD